MSGKLPKLPSLKEITKHAGETQKTEANKMPVIPEKKERYIIPKTQYDSEGNPLLAIPDLDLSRIREEMDRTLTWDGAAPSLSEYDKERERQRKIKQQED